MEITFYAFIDDSLKGQERCILYKFHMLPWLYSSTITYYSWLGFIKRSFEHLITILAGSVVYLNLDGSLLGKLRKNKFSVMMGRFGNPVFTSLPKVGILKDNWGSTLADNYMKISTWRIQVQECCRWMKNWGCRKGKMEGNIWKKALEDGA